MATRLMQDPEHASTRRFARSSASIPTSWGRPGAPRALVRGVRVGAFMPLAPFLVPRARRAVVGRRSSSRSARSSSSAPLVSLLTGRGLVFSGLRQVAIGGAAALVTYLVGSAIGVGRCVTRPEVRALLDTEGVRSLPLVERPVRPLRRAPSCLRQDPCRDRGRRSPSTFRSSAAMCSCWPPTGCDLPAGTLHSADVGADGVTCLEGHVPAGSLGRTVEHFPAGPPLAGPTPGPEGPSAGPYHIAWADAAPSDGIGGRDSRRSRRYA